MGAPLARPRRTARRDDVRDVRLALCGDHLRQRISGGALLIKQGWAYD